MEQLIFTLEIIGTIAFAFSGAIVAIKKSMDMFGVSILAITTSVGGGIIRDITLGNTPPKMFFNPIYAITAFIISILVFIYFYYKKNLIINPNKKTEQIIDWIISIADALGLGIFTTIGVKVSIQILNHNIFLAIFTGVVTGCGGGVIRDIMAGQKPYIFVKHIYALSSIFGSIICYILWNLNNNLAILLGLFSVFTIRMLSKKFELNLPRIKYNKNLNKNNIIKK